MNGNNSIMRTLAMSVTLVAAGIAATLGVQRLFSGPSAPMHMPASSVPAAGTSMGSAPPTSVTLAPDVAARAGVRSMPVSAAAIASGLRAPGVVEINAYRQVVVTPVAGGRVTAVSAELGQDVREGQTLVEIFSPELAEAERAYLDARANLALVEQRRQRTEKLGGIGAISQQELDDVRADHQRQLSAVEGARARLGLLGLSVDAIAAIKSAADIAPVVRVPAPSAGVVVTRTVNRGQNVETSTELVTIADLSTVWVIVDIYERDMALARVGGTVRITSAALAAESWSGRIAYVDPQVTMDTRTIKARVEVANPRRTLKPGLLVDVALEGAASGPVVVVPRGALQQAGARTLVFLDAPGGYEARAVTVGRVTGDSAEVLTGLSAGDVVVVEGAFAVKAEWERIGGRLPESTVQRLALTITEKGFEPSSFTVTAGMPIELVVTRLTDNTCGTEVVVGTNGPRADLPLNTPVTLKIAPMAKGELQIACGMAMLKGAVVAR